ncbi:hypothetical protein GCM10022416_29690 [Actinomadura keratinilytica]|uniref:Uncharacterized protein n=1 Tax=Actinomadura keratinilytica TaxID=547461 RepID=A0ABP7YVH9_9ACTN
MSDWCHWSLHGLAVRGHLALCGRVALARSAACGRPADHGGVALACVVGSVGSWERLAVRVDWLFVVVCGGALGCSHWPVGRPAVCGVAGGGGAVLTCSAVRACRSSAVVALACALPLLGLPAFDRLGSARPFCAGALGWAY